MHAVDLLKCALLAGWLIVAALLVHAEPVVTSSAPSRDTGFHALVPDHLLAEVASPVTVIHAYGRMSLVRVEGLLPDEFAARTHAWSSADPVVFRGWVGKRISMRDPSGFAGGVVVFDLVGPLDQRWRSGLEAAAVEILAPAGPHGLVVKTDREGLKAALAMKTSEGFPIVRGFEPLPMEARVHRSLVPLLSGGGGSTAVEVQLFGFGGRSLSSATKGAIGGAEVVRLEPGRLPRLLTDHPDIGYVEPVFGIELHNNLAARPGLVAVEPVWDLGYNGTGVTVSHNDSGVDLSHPDLAGAVTATAGRMAYTDNAHGTHTAGTLVGRGTASFSGQHFRLWRSDRGPADESEGWPGARNSLPTTFSRRATQRSPR